MNQDKYRMRSFVIPEHKVWTCHFVSGSVHIFNKMCEVMNELYIHLMSV